MTNINARDMFAAALSSRLIEVCKETGYHKVGDQKVKINRELSAKYGNFYYNEKSLASFMAAAGEAIGRIFPDESTAAMMFSFHEKSLFDTFNKIKSLTEKEKALDGLVKSTFFGSATFENFKDSVMGLVKGSLQADDIDCYFRLHSSGEIGFVPLVGSLINALREEQPSKDWLGKSINI
jgi:hypothetical protein